MLTITKLDAAKRQLEMAIRLYFGSHDPVPIHTLTAAAYNIIKDMSKNSKEDIKMIFKGEVILEPIKPEFRKELIQKINEAENFFKHADTDPEKTLSFNPILTEMLLWDACRVYSLLINENLPLLSVFTMWYALHHQKSFSTPALEIIKKIKTDNADLILRGRQAFFQEMIGYFHGV